jgi:SAM-dependent methyltransferase
MNDKSYFNYLLKRSQLSNIYRKFILYPRLAAQLSGKVLDVGCGIGDFLKFRRNTIGIDINEFNVSHCNQIGLEAYKITDGKYPFNDKTFDGAILDNVLEHLSDPTVTINEISRVLTEGGTLIIGVPGIKGYTMDDDHKMFYTEDQLEGLLLKHNFSLVKYIYGPLMIKSAMLSKSISQYCIYGVFKKL